MKLTVSQLALAVLLAGTSTAFADYARSCSGTPALVQISSSNDTEPYTAGNDRTFVIGKPDSLASITMTTGGQACGTAQNGGGTDTDFATSATYGSSFVIFVDHSNTNPNARIPLNFFLKNSQPTPGTLYRTLTALDADDACFLVDSSSTTTWFKKACMIP